MKGEEDFVITDEAGVLFLNKGDIHIDVLDFVFTTNIIGIR